MAGELIFITGATGFIGSAISLAALKAGYRLRICLRGPSGELSPVLSQYSQRIDIVFVSDFAEEAVLRGKLDGADYVLHLGHPLPSNTDKSYYFAPAVTATNALLKEAARVPSIKKVVITSSVAALMPLDGIPPDGIVREDNEWDFEIDENEDFACSEDPRGIPMRLYHASKLLANKTAWEFRKAAKPHYALVTLHPVFVYGHNPAQKSAEEIGESSNGLLWYTLMAGEPHRTHSQVPGVHIDDVVEAHIKALGPHISDGSRYLLSGGGRTWKEVADIVERDYPHLGAMIKPSIQGGFLPMDTSKAEADLGMQWRSWEQMIRDVVGQQLSFNQLDHHVGE